MRPIFYVAVGGSRSIESQEFINLTLGNLLIEKRKTHEICLLLSDEAGVSYLAHAYAKRQGLMVKYYPTYWAELKTRAPMNRDKQILLEAHLCVSFWDGINAQGLQLPKMAKEAAIPTRVFRVDHE